MEVAEWAVVDSVVECHEAEEGRASTLVKRGIETKRKTCGPLDSILSSNLPGLDDMHLARRSAAHYYTCIEMASVYDLASVID